MIKKITTALYVLIIVLMAAASIIENYNGTPFTHQYIYGSWWFSLGWALLAGFGIAYLLKQMGYPIAPSFFYHYPCRGFTYTYTIV